MSLIFDREALIFAIDVSTEGLVAYIAELFGLSIGYDQVGSALKFGQIGYHPGTKEHTSLQRWLVDNDLDAPSLNALHYTLYGG